MRNSDILALYKAHGGVRWMLWAAQGYVESRWNPAAQSPAGCLGIAQFAAATWSDCIQHGWAPAGSSPLDPVVAIPAQIAYMGWLLPRCHGSERGALAAYNWGIGNVQKLQNIYTKGWETKLPPETFAYIRQVLVLAEWLGESD